MPLLKLKSFIIDDTTANDSFARANASFSAANNAYTQANTASEAAAAAFSAANNATDTWVRNQANNAFSQANGAFLTANTAYAWGNHATYNYATETYVGTQISNLVNSAPTTLDTLNELATALGSDANFATTVSTNIGVAHAKANAAFGQANAAFTAANNATDTWVRNQANNAYDTANAAFTAANNSTDTWVRTQANNAYNTANSAGSFANGAFLKANASYLSQNTTAEFANAAFARANAAFTTANTAGSSSSVNTYINMTMTGAISSPYIGTSRFYPPANVTISTVYANLSAAATTGNFTFIIKKNGTSIGNTFTITQNQTVMTPATINVNLVTTDYLTLDVNGANATDLFVRIKYTNT